MADQEILRVNDSVIEARDEAFNKANPALREKIDWVIDWQKTEAARGIMGRWELGKEIDEIIVDETENQGRRFGAKSKSTIALFMSEDPSVIVMAHKVFCTWPDRKKLAEITEMTMMDQRTHLSYSHIRQLVAIKDETIRMKLLNACLLNCWTSAELGLAVQKANGGKQTNNPNGRATMPKDAQTVIGQMIDFADDFDSRNVRVWRDAKHSLSAQVDKLKPIEYTEDLARKLGELAHRMRQLADEATLRAEEAEAKYDQVNKTLKLGAAGIKSAAELVSTSDEAADTVTKRGNKPVGRRQKAA